MIIDFTVENFKSIKDEQVFSMEYDSNDKETHTDNLYSFQDTKLLKRAVICGANASGKSNFIEAFRTLRSLVLESANKFEDIEAYYQPFEFDVKTEFQGTKFEITFVIEEIKYNYYLVYKGTAVSFEKLEFYPNGRKTKLFLREHDDFEFGKELKGEKKTVEKLTDYHQLFLSKGAQNNMPQLKNIYEYFKNSLMVIPFLDSWIDTKYSERIARELIKENNQEFIDNFNAMITTLDTGINKIEIKELKGTKVFDTLRRKKTLYTDYQIVTTHTAMTIDGRTTIKKFELERESTGTRKLFVIGGLILRALMNGRIIIIDEFERSLHHHISVFLINLFNNPKINTKGAQLIIATHDTRLIAKDNKLRRDQIWFTEKDEYGATDIFCLSDVKGVRRQGPFDKWYLANQLNAVPQITAFTFEEEFSHNHE